MRGTNRRIRDPVDTQSMEALMRECEATVAISPWFHLALAGGPLLRIPLEPAEEKDRDRIRSMWEDLWAMPGVQEVLEKYGVVIERAAKGADEK